MRALNVLLSVLVVAAMFVLALEGGLRLLGKGPGKTINVPDEHLGWVNRPDFTQVRDTKEFYVRLDTNAQSLRDDAMESVAKPEGTYRVLCLGDSFTLGFTVDRSDLFVDQLEGWWKAEGRKVEVLNAGVPAYSTDQEVAWFLAHGKQFEPDLVLLFPFENDIFWNGQLQYNEKAKPRFTADGVLEDDHIEYPTGWRANTAIGRMLQGSPGELRFDVPEADNLLADFLPLLNRDAPEMGVAKARTAGALKALRDACQEVGAGLVMAPIPSHALVDSEYRAKFAGWMKLEEGVWSPDNPVDFFLETAASLGIPSLDARPALLAAQANEDIGSLYYDVDFHLNPTGNQVFASFLKEALDGVPAADLPLATTPLAAMPAFPDPAPRPGPRWPWFYGALVALLGSAYAWTYRDQENPALGFLKVAVLLGVIFAIVIGGGSLVGVLPPRFGQLFLYLFILGVVGFIIYKLGRRTATILELFGAFMGRGHWYLMPLVVILLTIGSLLVVAASSPLVAPFIYTLF